MFTFLDKSVQLESEPERSRKFSILHAEKHRNQWQAGPFHRTEADPDQCLGGIWRLGLFDF